LLPILSRLNVRKILECRLRRSNSLPTSMDATPPLGTKAILNQSPASTLVLCTVVNPPTAGSLRGRIWPGQRGARKFPISPPTAIKRREGGRLRSPVRPPTRPLRPVMTDNTRPLRFTATAGTKLVGAYFSGESIISPSGRMDDGFGGFSGKPPRRQLRRRESVPPGGWPGGGPVVGRPAPLSPPPPPPRRLVYDPKAFFLFLSRRRLDQAFAHCPKFLTAA
jgi:hypothetical protein